MAERQQGYVSATSIPKKIEALLIVISEHMKRDHSRTKQCLDCKVPFRKDSSKKQLEELKERHKCSKTCVELPDGSMILSESQEKALKTYRKTKASRRYPRADLPLQNWEKMNLSLGLTQVDAAIMEGMFLKINPFNPAYPGANMNLPRMAACLSWPRVSSGNVPSSSRVCPRHK